MPKLFGVDIEKLINDNLGDQLTPVTLTKVAAGSRTPGSLTGGVNPTISTVSTSGIIDDYSEYQVDGTIVVRGDRRLLLIGKPLTDAGVVPAPNDRATIEGTEYNIVNVQRDPAAATYTCQVRK